MWFVAPQLSYLPLSSSKLNQIKHVYRNDEKPVSNNTVKQTQAECENFEEKTKQNACSSSYSLIGSICLEQAYRLLPWRPGTQMNISYANSVGHQLQPMWLSQPRASRDAQRPEMEKNSPSLENSFQLFRPVRDALKQVIILRGENHLWKAQLES